MGAHHIHAPRPVRRSQGLPDGHNLMIGVVHGGTDQVVHRRVDDRQFPADAGLTLITVATSSPALPTMLRPG